MNDERRMSPAGSLNKRLRRLVQEAYEFVPFYRRHWNHLLPAIRQSQDLATLPILRKADLLAVPASERIDRRYAAANLGRETTSGSSGQPFTVYFDKRVWLRRRIRFIRGLLACGYRPGQKLMLISSRHSAPLMRLVHWHYVDLQLGERELCSRYQQMRPQTLYGPLSALLLLAGRNMEHPQPHRPKLVISTAEQLTSLHRRQLERAFEAPVADLYGSTELGLVAWRAPATNYYTWASRTLYAEFLPMGDGSNMEHLIVSDLYAGPSPLIRFDTGDLVRRDHERPDRPICEFAGRSVDCLRLPDGSRISPYQVTMSLEDLPVDRYEVVQRANESIDITLWTKTTGADALARRAEEIVARLCAHQVKVSAHQSTEDLPLTGRKFRPVRSEIVSP